MPDDRRLTLVVPAGAEGYPISSGTESYAPFREDIENPRSRWLVKVPPEAATGLLHVGGFSMAETKIQVPHGFALVRHPTDPNASVGGGEPDGHGNIVVPAEAVADLIAHGFVAVDTGAPAPAVLPGERDQALAKAAAQVMDLSERLRVAGQAAVDLADERDVLKDRVAELERQNADLTAALAQKPAAAPEADKAADKTESTPPAATAAGNAKTADSRPAAAKAA